MLRKHRLSQSELAKYWRAYRASKSEEKRKQWSKERREREKRQRERELVEQEELAENRRQKQERKLTPQEEEKRRRHAEAQARYRAKMKKPTNEVESSTPPSTPNSKAKEIMEAIEKSTPRTSEKLTEFGVEKLRSRMAGRAIVEAASTAVKSDKTVRRSLIPLLRNANKKAVSEILGISRTHFNYHSKMGTNPRLTKTALERIVLFYSSSEVVTTCPYKSKSGKVIRIMKYTRKEAYKIFREAHADIKIGQTTFNKLKPSSIKLMKAAQWVQCICEICENIRSVISAIAQSMKRSFHDVPAEFAHTTDLVKLTVCDVNSAKCLSRKCQSCSVSAVTEILRQWLDDDDHREFSFYEWGRSTEVGKGKHIRKTKVTVSRQQAHQALLKMLHTFPSHTVNAMSQTSSFKLCKQNLENNEAIVIVDFAENYACRPAREAHSHYYNRNMVTIHPMGRGYYGQWGYKTWRQRSEGLHALPANHSLPSSVPPNCLL